MSAPISIPQRYPRARSTSRNAPESRSRSPSADSITTLNMNTDFSMVQRWNGRTREATDWNYLRRDPEIFISQGNCLVYLFDRGASRRGPSFRIPYDFLLYSSCRPLIEQALLSSLQSSLYHPGSNTPPSYENLHDPSSYEITYCSLYLDAPPGLSRMERFNYHITTRNFFAWLVGVPLVGPDPISALLELKVRMDMWRDPGADNFGALYNYVKEQEYGDFEDLEIQMGKRLEGDVSDARPQPYRNISNTLEEEEKEVKRGRRSSITSLRQAVRSASQSLRRRISRNRYSQEDSAAQNDQTAPAPSAPVPYDNRGRREESRGREVDRESIISKARRRLSGTRSSVQDPRTDTALSQSRTPLPGDMWISDLPRNEPVIEPQRAESRTRFPRNTSRTSLITNGSNSMTSQNVSRTNVSTDASRTASTTTSRPANEPVLVVSLNDTSAKGSDSIFTKAKRRLSRTRAPTNNSRRHVSVSDLAGTSTTDIGMAKNSAPLSSTGPTDSAETESLFRRGRRRVSRSRMSSVPADKTRANVTTAVQPNTAEAASTGPVVPATGGTETPKKRERRVSWAAAPSTVPSTNASQTNLALSGTSTPKPMPPILKTKDLPTSPVDQFTLPVSNGSAVTPRSSRHPPGSSFAHHSASSSKTSLPDLGICECCGKPRKPRSRTHELIPLHSEETKKTINGQVYQEIQVPNYGNGLDDAKAKRTPRTYTVPGQPPTTSMHSSRASTQISLSSGSAPSSSISALPPLDFQTQSPSTDSSATGTRSRDISIDRHSVRPPSIIHGVDMSELEVERNLDALITSLATDDLNAQIKGKAPVRPPGYIGLPFVAAEAPQVPAFR